MKNTSFSLGISFVSNASKFRDLVDAQYVEAFEAFVEDQETMEQFIEQFQYEKEDIIESEIAKRLEKYEARSKKNNINVIIKRAKQLAQLNLYRFEDTGNAKYLTKANRHAETAQYYAERKRVHARQQKAEKKRNLRRFNEFFV